ncbi:TetR/AcrR family transcriptional regulator [Flavobacterium sp. ACN6]|uniref:TetR/AcrR family transcriptional regulator n=1 Tax=Flavobacterium sp. ACN6 TaxID=1920426 RepID=UPI000BB3D714|nr:TetR/AcrR family transcriptional regulator [Flavobacterium sp. ACN6]PBJ07992.1 HTH-type transcriptional regulator EthR [Flavobacterium sp. ACN6]
MKNKQLEILETAAVLFSKGGIKKTSVEIISRQCGISKKTFYTYYSDKEAVIKDIVENALSRTEKYASTLSETSSDAACDLIRFFKFIQNNIAVFTPVFISDLFKFYPAVNDCIREYRSKKFLPFFMENIKRGVQEGCYRKSVDGKLTGELYFRQIDLTLEDDSLTALEKFTVLSYINSFFLHGIVNGFGVKQLYSDGNQKCSIKF